MTNEKIICAGCGAEYEVSLVRCPFCGKAYAPAEEAEYMDTLEDIREDLHDQVPEEEQDPALSESCEYEPDNDHEDNMREFEEKFSDTEEEVSRFARAVEGLGKKAAILVVLIIGIIVSTVTASANYADPDTEKEVRKDTLKNIDLYIEDADAYLERGEYMEFATFLYAHELMNLSPEEFERFRGVKYVAQEYYECMELLEEIVLRSDDPEYFDSSDTDIRMFCMYVESFYEVFDAQTSSEKNRIYLSYMTDMENELRAAIRTYFSMDEDGVKEFLKLSRAQKAVKLQEVIDNE